MGNITYDLTEQDWGILKERVEAYKKYKQENWRKSAASAAWPPDLAVMEEARSKENSFDAVRRKAIRGAKELCKKDPEKLVHLIETDFNPMPEIFRDWYADLINSAPDFRCQLSGQPILTPVRYKLNDGSLSQPVERSQLLKKFNEKNGIPECSYLALADFENPGLYLDSDHVKGRSFIYFDLGLNILIAGLTKTQNLSFFYKGLLTPLIDAVQGVLEDYYENQAVENGTTPEVERDKLLKAYVERQNEAISLAHAEKNLKL